MDASVKAKVDAMWGRVGAIGRRRTRNNGRNLSWNIQTICLFRGRNLPPAQSQIILTSMLSGRTRPSKHFRSRVYSHYRKFTSRRLGATEIAKSNILLIGPTGTGKTLLCETLSRILCVPFVTANATSLAQSKYVNEEIEALLFALAEQGTRRYCQCPARYCFHRRD